MSSKTTSLKKTNKNFIFLLLILAIFFPFLNLSPLNLFIFSLFYIIFIIIFLNHKLGLFLLIIIRPFTEIITNFEIFKIKESSVNFSYIIGIITIIFGVLVISSNFEKIKKAPLLKILISFIILIFISIFYSFDKNASLIEFFRMTSLFLLYLSAFTLIKNKKDLLYLFIAIILSGFVPSIFGYFQYFTNSGFYIPFEGVTNRVYGTFTHPNLLAYYLIFPIAIALSTFSLLLKKDFIKNILEIKSQKILKVFLILFLVILILPFIFTFARGAWMVLFMVIFLFGFFNKEKSKRISFILIFTILSLSLFYISGSVRERIYNISTQYNSINWRLDHWEKTLKYTQQKPLMGHGAGTAEIFILDKSFDAYEEEAAIHNDYIKIATENGIIGLMIYLAIIFLIFYNLFNIFRKLKLPEDKMIISLIIFLSLAVFLSSFYDNILKNTALQWIYWILLGSVFFLYQKQLEK